MQENTVEYEVKWSGLDKKISADKFKGGKLTVEGAGIRLDFSQAKIPKGTTAVLEIKVIGGGIKLVVPSTWEVDGQLSTKFAGFSNTTTTPKTKTEGKLVLKGSVTFGGVQISNE